MSTPHSLPTLIGEELDRFCAIEIMGWEPAHKPHLFVRSRADGRVYHYNISRSLVYEKDAVLWWPSQNPEQAMQMIAAFSERTNHGLSLCYDPRSRTYGAIFQPFGELAVTPPWLSPHYNQLVAIHAVPAAALCFAALKLAYFLKDAHGGSNDSASSANPKRP